MTLRHAFYMMASLMTIELVGATAFGMAQQLPTERASYSAPRRTVARKTVTRAPVSHPMSSREVMNEDGGRTPSARARSSAANCDQGLKGTTKSAQHTLDAANRAIASQKMDGSFLSRLNAVATANANKCRYAAKFRGGARICGNQSKGLCATAVRETLNTMHIPMGRGNAIDQKAFLRKNLQVIDEASRGHRVDRTLCAKSEPGVVCLYSTTRHSYGHIEIKTGANKYCSDYCSAHSAVSNIRGQFTLVGVYRIKE